MPAVTLESHRQAKPCPLTQWTWILQTALISWAKMNGPEKHHVFVEAWVIADMHKQYVTNSTKTLMLHVWHEQHLSEISCARDQEVMNNFGLCPYMYLFVSVSGLVSLCVSLYFSFGFCLRKSLDWTSISIGIYLILTRHMYPTSHRDRQLLHNKQISFVQS